MRLTIIGGGGFRVPLVYRALLAAAGSVPVTDLVLYDTDPARTAVIARVLRGMRAVAGPAVGEGPAVRVETDPAVALRGADAVLFAIRPGGTAGRARDERLALAEGVLGQETVGAAGILYALRTVPEAVRFAELVREVAPNARVVNFTNPAGIVTEAMSAVLGPRVIGICDSPAGLIRRAARAAGADPGAVRADYVGLNHLGWLRSLTVGGRDLLPDLLADDRALASFEEGRLFGGPWLRALGALPNEYLYYHYFRRESLEKAWEAAETRGEFLDRQQSAFFAEAASLGPADPADPGEGPGAGEAARETHRLWESTRREREETYLAEAREASGGWSRDERELAEGGGYEWVALDVLRGLFGGGDRHPAGRGTDRVRLVLNARNADTVPALGPGAIVETVCELSPEGAHPVPCPAPGPAELGLMLQIKAVERAVIEAALTGSETAALRAMALHPLVDSPAVAARLLARARAGNGHDAPRTGDTRG
ncbi:6-phospho-beta-glucosidase [Streptomyces calidiresistens]|uniref:6-phospho-beta-glucosidase n=1 Tax=Streptomyces calidiresistens TaxID=1485586 RepID=A0A7W3T0C8_9ACTN|nr:6-phospho-beta-glucosidase [Streptomyces calidiresistens]MBB0228582.1 6-phospho-beta-glucosidase [Streptomyces calidiresistens]